MIINQWRPVNHYFPNAVTVSYYDITLTAEDLRVQMNSKGPVDSHDHIWDALTQWFIRWCWPGFGQSPCELDKATVSYEVKVIFPRWIPLKDASPKLVAQWEDYISALAEHEKGHVDYIVKNYQSVAVAIKNANCHTADSAAHAALVPLRKYDDEYDAITDHGKTQGARFP
jgi:predicted secreted Zn-dependent protease